MAAIIGQMRALANRTARMQFALARESRIGARRINQDRVAYWHTARSLLMVVADGLGGHPHGELAAQLAVQRFGAAFDAEARPSVADPGAFLSRGVAAAHRDLLAEAQRRRLHDVPRTVIVACLVQEGHAWWIHVGDCRLYFIRGAQVLARTRDHTMVQQLLDEGRLSEEAIAAHPERNRLLQCLGGYQVPQPDAPAPVRLAKNDVLLLCSDGLWGALTSPQLLHTLLAKALPEAVADLAALAEGCAGAQCDNVSVLAVTWGEEEMAA